MVLHAGEGKRNRVSKLLYHRSSHQFSLVSDQGDLIHARSVKVLNPFLADARDASGMLILKQETVEGSHVRRWVFPLAGVLLRFFDLRAIRVGDPVPHA